MSRNYKFHNPEGLYFVSFAVVDWLDVFTRNEYKDFLDKPEKCYDNWNRKPSSGLVTKFNDDVFNVNVTITAQDSTSINNQNLIENLENGLYKIDKIYEDGSTQETLIFKEGN